MTEQSKALENISEELLTLIRASVEMGLASIEGDEDMTPMFNNPISIIVLDTKTIEEARATVQKVIQSGTIERGVLIYNGRVTLPTGERHRLLLLEGYESGQDTIVRFNQYYRPPVKAGFFGKKRPLERIGRLKFMPASIKVKEIQ